MNQRADENRRKKPTTAISPYTIMGKRRISGRRDSDNPGYVDLYHPLLFFILLGIILLSLVDAYFTLETLSKGGLEVNPAMRAALGLGATSFIIIKICYPMKKAFFL